MKGAAVAVVVFALTGCGGDAEENLLGLPERMAVLCREGAWADVWDNVADDFSAHGISKVQARIYVAKYLEESGYRPYVANVAAAADLEGEDEQTLSVLGVLCRGDPTEAKPRHIRPLRLEIEVKREGDDWLVTGATVHR